MRVKQLINNYLKESYLLQIATSGHNIPWICTVCFGFDTSFNLYWFSRHDTRHSQEILQNNCVAGAVVLPYVKGNKSRGLQFAGIAVELHDVLEIEKGLGAMRKRYDMSKKREIELKNEMVSGDANYGLYRFIPEEIILYDTKNFPDAPRQVYSMTTTLLRKDTE